MAEERGDGSGGFASSENLFMSNIEKMITEKLSSFENKITRNQKDIADSQLHKMQEDILCNDSYHFKKKSCEDQFKFNVQVISKLKEADNNVKKLDLDDASASIAKGMTLLSERQKLIKMADTSEHGWAVVKEYVTNPLAEDSDDEKRISRAENRANKKVKALQAKRIPRGIGRPSRFSPYRFPTPTATVPFPGAPAAGASYQRPQPQGRPGLCFNCGKPGHWKFECRAGDAVKGSDFKISSFMSMGFTENIVTHDEKHVINHDLNVEKDCSQVRTNSDRRASEVKIDNAKGAILSEVKSTVSPVGRLRANVEKWDKIGVRENIYIRNVIVDGYKLPFKTLPSSVFLRNNKSARDNPEFVVTEIDSLLDKNCISEICTKPEVVNPLTVAYGKKGKPRLVLDCRHINEHLVSFKYKYEDVSVARNMFNKSDFLFTFDLKSAYHIVEIFEGHRSYLGFSWDKDGKTHFYVFNVLPFGLSTAGFIFSKILRVAVKYLRADGHKIVTFLDDGLGGHEKRLEAVSLSKLVRQFLISLGFLIAEEKCVWMPAHEAVWMGYTWNMVTGTLHATDDRISRLENAIDSLFYQVKRSGTKAVSVRFLASIVGQIISLQNSLGNIVCLKTRVLYRCIDTRLSWNSPVFISEEAFQELEFWKTNARILNVTGSKITDDVKIDFDCFSDASGSGFGGYVALCEGALLEGSEIYGVWDKEESNYSSTWREAEAIDRNLKSNVLHLKGKEVNVFSDNKNVSIILDKGSKNPGLHDVVQKIGDFCQKNDIKIHPKWVPRHNNVKADELSRKFDNDDWKIQKWVFDQFNCSWGNFTVDRFASNLNTQCLRFNSKFWCPGCESIDAFEQDWSKDNNWFVPPPACIIRVVQKCLIEKANGTLIVPEWRSSAFWPLLVTVDGFKNFIKDSVCLPNENIIETGTGNNGIFADKKLKFNMIALKLRF